MNISIFGLGYVGTTCAACLAELGHRIVGVDANDEKVRMISGGRSPVVEEHLTERVERAVKEGRLLATSNPEDAVAETDAALICVGTPSRPNGSLDLDAVRSVAVDIGEALRNHIGYFLVVVRSTVLPGTVEEAVIRTLEEVSGKPVGRDYGVCVNPEFLREGSSVKDFFEPSRIVIGSTDAKAGDAAEAIYRGIDAPVFRTSIRVAEMVKYCDNAFHALKVTFANEIGRICKRLEIDSHSVMDIFCADRKLNISPTYLKPGFAFGGSCLPKDLRALTYEARYVDVDTPVLNAIIPSNNQHISSVARMLLGQKGKTIGVLGLAFKSGTDDLRESPIVELIEFLLGKGFPLKVYDRNVNLARLIGANRAYIEKAIPHIACLLTDDPDDVVRNSDVVIVGNRSKEFLPYLAKMTAEQMVIDLVRIIDDGRANARSGAENGHTNGVPVGAVNGKLNGTGNSNLSGGGSGDRRNGADAPGHSAEGRNLHAQYYGIGW